MGRTTPTSTEIVAREKELWKQFRQALDCSRRPIFDDMMDLSKLDVMAISNLIRQHPTIQRIQISIMFEHYRRLNEMIDTIESDRVQSQN